MSRSPSTRGVNWPPWAGTTSRWAWKSTTGPSRAPTSAWRTGSPSKSRSRTSMSRASSQPLMNAAAERMASGLEVSYVMRRSARTRSSMTPEDRVVSVSGRIVLFGATGYTGELTARALVDRGARPILAARSAERLNRLTAELGGLETRVADVAEPATIHALVEKGDVLISTVGPFVRMGEPAVQAATAAGAHYLDSTGEGAFIRTVFERHGPAAQTAGCGLLTAFGYDFVPGNLA